MKKIVIAFVIFLTLCISIPAIADVSDFDFSNFSFEEFIKKASEMYSEEESVEDMTAFEIDDMGLSISVPSTFDVFTRDISNDDPLLAKYNFDAMYLKNFLMLSDIYLNAVDGPDEIVIAKQENIGYDDFNHCGESTLKYFCILLEDSMNQLGITITEQDIYYHPQMSFIRYCAYNPAMSAHSLQYLTVKNNNQMCFSLTSNDGEITEIDKKMMQSVIDSIVFYNDTLNNDSAETSPAFLYKDEDSGATLIVPANWEIKSLPANSDMPWDLCLESGTALFFYCSDDTWSSRISLSQKLLYPRSSIDNSFIPLDDYAEYWGADPSTISEVTYNGKNYYMLEGHGETDVSGKMVPMTDTILVRAENGWEYVFYFSETPKSTFYKDFESLMESIEYPASSN